MCEFKKIEPGVHRVKCSECQRALYIYNHKIATINMVNFAAEKKIAND